MTQSGALRPAWTPLTIALMVLGFVFFWPLGLGMLAYILWGDHLHKAFSDVRDQFGQGARSMGSEFGFGTQRTGNAAFDEYRERELKRLEEERRRIDAMRAEFDEYMANLRRARDQEEFDRFMAERRRATGTGPEPTGAATV